MTVAEARKVAKSIIRDAEDFLLEKDPELLFGYENADITLCKLRDGKHIEPVFGDDLEPYVKLLREGFPQYHWDIYVSQDYYDTSDVGIDLKVREVDHRDFWDGVISLSYFDLDDDEEVDLVWEDA